MGMGMEAPCFDDSLSSFSSLQPFSDQNFGSGLKAPLSLTEAMQSPVSSSVHHQYHQQQQRFQGPFGSEKGRPLGNKENAKDLDAPPPPSSLSSASALPSSRSHRFQFASFSSGAVNHSFS